MINATKIVIYFDINVLEEQKKSRRILRDCVIIAIVLTLGL
jgi:hypothetical protein